MPLLADLIPRTRMKPLAGVAFAWIAIWLLCGSATCQPVKRPQEEPLSRIAFGSCANQSAPQPVWDPILEYGPELFVWLGDNIYADEKSPVSLWGRKRNVGPKKTRDRFLPVSVERMREKYAEARRQLGYQRLREGVEVIGTWDDHDYGLNDVGKELPMKLESMQLMLDFLDEPDDSPRRRQDGVYAAYDYGPPGKKIKVILLDLRYNRDKLGTDGQMLGAAQWRWFEDQLRASDAQIHVIGSSIQVLANLSAMVEPFFKAEGWGRFAREQRRLFDLIRDSRAPGVIFISGDVHFAEMNRYDCSGVGYPLLDLTSSGLTQAAELAFKPPFGYLARLASMVLPKPMRVMSLQGPGGDRPCRTAACTYGYPNFGVITVDWDHTPVRVTLEARDLAGSPVVGYQVDLDELRPRQGEGGGVGSSPPALKRGELRKFCTREVDHPWYLRCQLAIWVFASLAVLMVLPFIVVLTALLTLRWFLQVKRKAE
eukprot:jgi/Mesen1/3932/ME000209S02948